MSVANSLLRVLVAKTEGEYVARGKSGGTFLIVQGFVWPFLCWSLAGFCLLMLEGVLSSSDAMADYSLFANLQSHLGLIFFVIGLSWVGSILINGWFAQYVLRGGAFRKWTSHVAYFVLISGLVLGVAGLRGLIQNPNVAAAPWLLVPAGLVVWLVIAFPTEIIWRIAISLGVLDKIEPDPSSGETGQTNW